MLIIDIAFWVLLLWGLNDGDLYPREGCIYAAIWIGLALGMFLAPAEWLWLVPFMALLDVILVLKVIGQDVPISYF